MAHLHALVVVVLLVYAMGTVTAITTLYLMITRKFLHSNFRILMMISIFGGQIVSVMACMNKLRELLHVFQWLPQEIAINAQRYGSMLFHIGHLFIFIERAAAIVAIARYEKCVTPLITFLIALITMTSWLKTRRRISAQIVKTAPLRMKFQHKENGRTAPIYTSILLNELFSSVLFVITMGFIEKTRAERDDAAVLDLLDLFHLIAAYRILFINIVVIYNCRIWRREQKRALVTDYKTADQYFRELKCSWDGTRWRVPPRKPFSRILQ